MYILIQFSYIFNLVSYFNFIYILDFKFLSILKKQIFIMLYYVMLNIIKYIVKKFLFCKFQFKK